MEYDIITFDLLKDFSSYKQVAQIHSQNFFGLRGIIRL